MSWGIVCRLGLCFCLTILCCGGVDAATNPKSTEIVLENEPLQPLEKPTGLDPARVALGRQIFEDKKLSQNNSVSCATCHDLERGGTKNVALSMPGVSGKTLPIRIPSIIGSGLNFAQFWNGRAKTLEDQIEGPTHDPDEMASSWPEIVQKLKASPEYTKAFQRIYHSAPTPDAIRNAIATFERSIVYIDSPFDQYLRGDGSAISSEAKQGYQLFKNLGCASCHQGQNVGGNMFQKFGIVDDYFAKRGHISEDDFGRYNVTHDENDRYYFKVPSLRNVALIGPYFHDGSAQTLENGVDTMAVYQLGHTLSSDERGKIVAFLQTLTGKPPLQTDRDTSDHE